MEKLDSLEASLPPEQPPTAQAIASLNSDLNQEFKIAANAVTKLYRTANEKNSLLKHQGYIECADNILSMLENGEFSSLNEIRLWCIKQRTDRLGNENSKKIPTQKKQPIYDFEFEKKKNYNSPNFHLSMAPLSVEYTKPPLTDKKSRASLHKYSQNQINGDHCSEIREPGLEVIQPSEEVSTVSHAFIPDHSDGVTKKHKLETDILR